MKIPCISCWAIPSPIAFRWGRNEAVRCSRCRRDLLARPPVSEHRLSLTPSGKVRYQLKTPYRDGTAHVIFEPLSSPSSLRWCPSPESTCLDNGVFAPNSRHRARVTAAERGKGNSPATLDELPERPPRKRRASMSLKLND